MEKVTTVGIDLVKSVFSLHGEDGAGRCSAAIVGIWVSYATRQN